MLRNISALPQRLQTALLFNGDSPNSLSDGLSVLPVFASTGCKSLETGLKYLQDLECFTFTVTLILDVSACLHLATLKTL